LSSPTHDENHGTGWWASIKDSLSGVEHDYTTGNLSRAITLLAVPMVLEMALESVFAVADVFFVGRLGPDAIATVGITESVITLVYAVAIGLSMATTATVARRIGEKDKPGAVRSSTQALALGALIAIAIGIPGALFAPEIMALMRADPETIAIGSGYATVMFATNAVIMFLFLNNAIFRGAGDPVIAMRSLWLANGINLVLDPCLIFGLGPFPEMGLTGAAVATSIGRGVGVAYQFRALRNGTGRIHLAGPCFRLNRDAMVRLLRVSAGGIGQFLIATSSWVLLMRIMATFGATAVAGWTIAIRVVMFALMPSWGLSNAAATLVGQNLGAKQPDRAEKAVWMTGFYNMLFLVSVAVVFVLLAEPIVGLFLSGSDAASDAAVLATGVEALKVLSYGYVFYAWGLVLVQAFNGAGDTGTPTRMNLVCFWMCQIPLAWILAKEAGWGPSGVIWAVVISESLLTVISLIAFRRGKWKERTV
jgi:putative MATE family efflux protein